MNVVVAVLMKHLEESNKKMADTGSEAGGTTGGTDTEGNPKTDTDAEDKDTEPSEVYFIIYINILLLEQRNIFTDTKRRNKISIGQYRRKTIVQKKVRFSGRRFGE